jgi:flagellar basal-body rod protein FlgB
MDIINHCLMGKTVGLLSHALGLRAKNHTMISSNLSNIDTPGYRPKGVNFEEELKKAVGEGPLPLNRTQEGHLPASPASPLSGEEALSLESLVEAPPGELDIDTEMSKMVRNNLLYEATAKMLSKKFEALRMVMDEKRG